MTTTATKKFTHGIYCDGIVQWKKDAAYDFLTMAPKIVAIAAGEKEAQSWIDGEMARQQRTIAIMPGSGEHRTYSVVRLDSDEAYLSKQNIRQGQSVNYGLRKKALISDAMVAKL